MKSQGGAPAGPSGHSDEWRGNAQDRQHWRDTHFKVEGPVVAEMCRLSCNTTVADRLEQIFADDKRRSREITLSELRHRPLKEKLWEHTAGLLRSQM